MAKGTGMGRLQKIGLGFEVLASSLCLIILVVLLIVVGLMGMGLSKIIMGAVYFDDCKKQDLIPVYLIVSGVSTILMLGLSQFKPSTGEKQWKFMEKLNFLGIVGLLGVAFYFIWLFYGCILIFGNFQDSIDKCPGETSCCDADLIKFALFTAIVDLIVCAAFIIGLVLMICCCWLTKEPPEFSTEPISNFNY